jgi:hypothetical protein
MRKKKPVISNTGKFVCFNNNVSNLYDNSVVEQINFMAYIFTLLIKRTPLYPIRAAYFVSIVLYLILKSVTILNEISFAINTVYANKKSRKVYCDFQGGKLLQCIQHFLLNGQLFNFNIYLQGILYAKTGFWGL